MQCPNDLTSLQKRPPFSISIVAYCFKMFWKQNWYNTIEMENWLQLVDAIGDVTDVCCVTLSQ
jgi:hypothetical protein